MTKPQTRIYGLTIPIILLMIFFAFAKKNHPGTTENIDFECMEYLYTFHDDPQAIEYQTKDETVIEMYKGRIAVVYHFYPCEK